MCKEVIVGFRMSVDNRKKIAELVSNKYPDVTLFQGVLSQTNFDVDILPYSDS